MVVKVESSPGRRCVDSHPLSHHPAIFWEEVDPCMTAGHRLEERRYLLMIFWSKSGFLPTLIFLLCGGHCDHQCRAPHTPVTSAVTLMFLPDLSLTWENQAFKIRLPPFAREELKPKAVRCLRTHGCLSRTLVESGVDSGISDSCHP